MPPRLRIVAPPVLLAAAAATSLVGVLTWAWYAFAPTPVRPSRSSSCRVLDAADPRCPAQSETVSESTSSASDPSGVKPRPRSGPKTSLTLATNIVRPLARFGRCVPRTLTFSPCHQLPPVEILNRLSSHFNVHLLLPSLPFDATLLPAYAATFDRRRLLFHETSEGVIHVVRALGGTVVKVLSGVEGIPIPGADSVAVRDDIAVERLVKEVRTFVGDVVLVGKGSEGAQLGKGVRAVGGWEELLDVFGV